MRLKPLADVVVDHKNVNSALVVDGYQCVDRSLSKVTRIHFHKHWALVLLLLLIVREENEAPTSGIMRTYAFCRTLQSPKSRTIVGFFPFRTVSVILPPLLAPSSMISNATNWARQGDSAGIVQLPLGAASHDGGRGSEGLHRRPGHYHGESKGSYQRYSHASRKASRQHRSPFDGIFSLCRLGP